MDSEPGKGAEARPLSSEDQRHRLIAAYQRTGNMSQAMREAGIRSRRTAYKWLARYQQDGAAGLVSRPRARQTQRTVPEALAGQIRQTKQEHPTWGKATIARQIAQTAGQAVSPSGVEAVLRRAELWTPRAPVLLPSRLDREALLAALAEGIHLDGQDATGATIRRLAPALRQALTGDEQAELLHSPTIGPWLLNGLAHLGHSYMHAGAAERAAACFRTTLRWLGEERQWHWRQRQRTWEEHYTVFGSSESVVPWCHSALSIILGAREPAAHRHIDQAVRFIIAGGLAGLPDRHVAVHRGNMLRDRARLRLALGDAGPAVERDLRASRADLAGNAAEGMEAATESTWAHVRSIQAAAAKDHDRPRWIAALDQMQAEIATALALVEQDISFVLPVMLVIETTRLQVRHGLAPDSRRLASAARACLTYGYGGHAGALLALPGIERSLSAGLIEQLTAAFRPKGAM